MKTSTIESKVCVIVADKAAFDETLFKPINGRTADGYVVKRNKNYCDVWLCGEVYRLNRHLVFCKMTKQADGRTWYSYADLPFTLMALDEAARTLVAWSEWKGGEILRHFTGSAPVAA